MYNNLLSRLQNQETQIAIIGLGYVGLPIALAFADKVKVLAYDLNSEKIRLFKKGIDPNAEITTSSFQNKDILFTDDSKDLESASFYIITVPTPIDKSNQPDLSALQSASQMVGKYLQKGDIVVYESTVYPGCTEEECMPILQKTSGLKFNEDFAIGYSPERINPGDTQHTFENINKVVSASDTVALDVVQEVYSWVIQAEVFPAASIKVAEAAKVIENTQRDLNIALMNELSMIFDKMNINTFDVLEAAQTKWNFLPFTPGLVGGHCIGVDPYYLTHKAIRLGISPKVILSGRDINDSMGFHVASKTAQFLYQKKVEVSSLSVLVMGFTFKENVKDIRNTRVADLVAELQKFNIKTDIHDPYVSTKDIQEHYGFSLIEQPLEKYDAIIVAVQHEQYLDFDESYFSSLMKEEGILIDVKGIYRHKIKNLKYWSL